MNIFKIKFTIPKGLIWFTLVACVLPTLLNLVGISFDSSGDFSSLNSKLILDNDDLKKNVYALSKGKFVHIIFLTCAIVVAILSSIISLFDYNYKKNAGVPIVGIALLSAGIFDIIHLLNTNQFIFVESKGTFGALTWFLSRFFHGTLILIGVLLFISNKKLTTQTKESKSIQFILFFSLNLLIITIVSLVFVLNSDIEPSLIFTSQFISRPYDLIPLAIYLILTFFALPKFSKTNPSQFTETLFLAMIPAVLTQLHMAFGSKVTFDNDYMIAQFLRLISYIIPLIGLMLNYLDTYQNEIKFAKELTNTIQTQRATKSLLQSVLNSSLSGVLAFETIRNEHNDVVDFKFIQVNKQAEKIMYSTAKKLLNNTLLTVSPEHKTNGLFAIYSKVVDTGISKNLVYPYEVQNTIIWFSISAVKMDYDGFTVTFTDITEQKHNEQKIIQSEYLYHSIASNIPSTAIFLMNKELIFELVEGKLLDEIGIDKKTSLNKHIDDALIKESSDIFKPIYKKTLAGETIEFEIESRGKIFQNYFTPIKNNSGNIIYAMCVATDITKKRKTEKALLNIEKLAITGNIARSIAHEIRNPLTNINLAKMNLKDELDQTEKNLYLSIIERNSERINKLITEMLESSKTTFLVEEKCTIEDIVLDVIEIVNDRIILKNISIEHTIKPNLKMICVDIEKIKVAFVNVIINAIEAIENTNGVIKINVSNTDDKCLIQISDNGLGIDANVLDEIFNPFYTNKPNGIGLGLNTTQNVILSHKGSIDVKSEKGIGTTFSITLNFCNS